MRHTERITLTCEQCGKEFDRLPCQVTRKGQGRFCSRNCMIDNKKNGSIVNCTNCGKKFYRRFGEQGNTINQFCSGDCYSEYRYKNLKDTTYKKILTRHEHRIVAENVLGRKLKKEEIVHHVDGNKHNNSVSNLAVLPNQTVHAKIHFGNESADNYLLINILRNK